MNTILFIDAYDSFSRNIVALLYQCIVDVRITTTHIDTDVERDFGVDIDLFLPTFDAVVLGPGPGDPQSDADVGLFKIVWEIAERRKIPVLGICLGFQSLCLYYGLSVTRMESPCHGQTKSIKSNGSDIFANLSDVVSMNYNSLGVSTLQWQVGKGDCTCTNDGADSGYSSDSSNAQVTDDRRLNHQSTLQLLAWDDEGYAMAVRHRELPLWGFQFHPESCMSNGSCHQLVRKWWAKTSAHNRAEREMVTREACTKSALDSSNVDGRSTAQDCLQEDVQASQARAHTQVKSVLQWTMLAESGLTMDDLSSYCHRKNGTETAVILESTAKGRYCIYAFTDDATDTVSYINGRLVCTRGTLTTSNQRVSLLKALKFLEDTTKSCSAGGGSEDVPFWGGYIGYISYEMCLDILHDAITQDPPFLQRDVPDFRFVFVQRSVVLDKESGKVYIHSIKEDDLVWIEKTRVQLIQLPSRHGQPQPAQKLEGTLQKVLNRTIIELPDHDTYTTQIRTCQSHLRAGNSYELCLTTEATITTPANETETPYLLYRNLNKHNPVPFASYLQFPALQNPDLPSTTILSTSPEQFLSWSRTGTLDMIPMKGTVPRIDPFTPTLAEATTILRNPKESAENLMIADLIRHDLHGIVGCKPHTHPSAPSTSTPMSTPTSPVEIVKLNEITPYRTVYQLTSHIRAHPPPSLDSNDTNAIIAHNHSSLLHTLPPGSMTGAPKRRSCQILRDLERRNRGIYSGIIGYMDVGGGGCWSVAIRTAWSSGAEDFNVSRSEVGKCNKENGNGMEGEKHRIDKFQKWHVGAGGAITVLSDVEGEWEEMMGKLRSVLRGFRS